MPEEKDESVIFDEKYLISLENKMLNKRTEADLLKELQKRAESEFKKIQTEYIKVDKVIKQNAIIPTDWGYLFFGKIKGHLR